MSYFIIPQNIYRKGFMQIILTALASPTFLWCLDSGVSLLININ